MSFKGESLAKAVKVLLKSELDAALVVVADQWEEDDPIDLDTEVTFLFGHHPTVLERPKSNFPIIAVMTGDSTPVPTSDQWVLPASMYEIYVDIFVAGDTEEEVSKRLLRFCEATMDVLEANQNFDSVTQRDRPSVSISEVNRQYESGMNVEFFTEFARLLLMIER